MRPLGLCLVAIAACLSQADRTCAAPPDLVDGSLVGFVPELVSPSGPRIYDLGNLASDGRGGRQMLVKPVGPSDNVNGWNFFPAHLPGQPDHTPATPAQADVYLTDDMLLLVDIPQVAYFPQLGKLGIDHFANGHELRVNAGLELVGGFGATITGAHEYALSLGRLEAGSYHLVFDLARSYPEFGLLDVESGYLDFVVQSSLLSTASLVPEPASFVLFGLGAVGLFAVARRRRA